MAQRRMFSLAVCDTDAFLDLPASSQCLYFHLGLRADDDGFVSSPRKITAMVNCSADDLKLLAAKGFVIPFESGVCVIRDWLVNNLIKTDRYHETRYTSEKNLLQIGSGNSYQLNPNQIQSGTQMEPAWNTLGNQMEPEVSLGKARQGKESGADKPPSRPRFVPPTVDQVRAYCQERGNSVDPERFVDYYEARGWTLGKGQPMRDWQAAVRTWERRETNSKGGDPYGDVV